LVSTFSEPDRTDMLSIWMAQYLAEQLSVAKVSRGKDREVARARCADLILKLWHHRHALPNGTRPFEAFEPILQTLDDLHSDRPRYSILRNLPPTKKLPEPALSFLVAARTLDRASSALIRYCLAQSVAHVPAKDRRWLKYVEAVEGKQTVYVRLMNELTSDADSLASQQAQLTEAAVKTLKELLSDLDEFDKIAAPMRGHLEHSLEQLETTS
jgi:hypothetical protein